MRVILVPIADRPECAVALTAALELASTMGSDIIGCHIRPHSRSQARLPRGLGVLAELGEADWDAAMHKRDPDRMSRDARSLFGRVTADAGLPLARRARADQSPVAIWQERVGSPQKVMPIVGPLSDLVVVSRPSQPGGRVAKAFLMQALLNSARSRPRGFCCPADSAPRRRSHGSGRRIRSRLRAEVQSAQSLPQASWYRFGRREVPGKGRNS